MIYKAICLTASLLMCGSAQAFELCGELKQGEIVVGQDDEVIEVVLSGKNYPVDGDGKFVLAFGRDQAEDAKITLMYGDTEGEDFAFKVAPAKWDIQRIDGLPAQKVTPDSGNDAEIKRERDDVAKAFATMTPGQYWRDTFIRPVEGRVSGTFGNQRVLNGQPKSPHNGMDIAALEGTLVVAPAGGKVIQSGGDYFYTGNVVTLDHGNGLQTIYAHLKTADVKVGDEVKQGQVIGTVGQTGRATGAHLHWGASLNGVRFDPSSLLTKQNKECHQL